jgi:hypothetical protein
MRLKALTVVSAMIMVFWRVTPCSLLDNYQRF